MLMFLISVFLASPTTRARLYGGEELESVCASELHPTCMARGGPFCNTPLREHICCCAAGRRREEDPRRLPISANSFDAQLIVRFCRQSRSVFGPHSSQMHSGDGWRANTVMWRGNGRMRCRRSHLDQTTMNVEFMSATLPITPYKLWRLGARFST